MSIRFFDGEMQSSEGCEPCEGGDLAENASLLCEVYLELYGGGSPLDALKKKAAQSDEFIQEVRAEPESARERCCVLKVRQIRCFRGWWGAAECRRFKLRAKTLLESALRYT